MTPQTRWQRSIPATWPLGLIGALITIGSVEFVLVQLDSMLSTPEAMAWRIAAKNAKGLGAVQGLILGDSLPKFGLLPGVLQERDGRVWWNLAVPSGQVLSSELLLDHALDAGARPDWIILSIAPRQLELGPEHNSSLYPEIVSANQCGWLAAQVLDPEFTGRLFVCSILPSYRGRFPIREMIQTASLRSGLVNQRWNTIYRRNITINQGSLVQSPKPYVLDDLAIWMDTYFPVDWKCHSIQARALDRVLQRTDELGIAVCWLISPLHPVVQDRCRSSGFDRRFDRFLESYRRRFPHLTVIDGRSTQLHPSEFWDPHHLALSGSLRLSRAVADLMAVEGTFRGSVQLPRETIEPPYRMSRSPELLSESSVVIRDHDLVR